MPISKNFIIKKVGNDYMIIPTTESNVNLSKIYKSRSLLWHYKTEQTNTICQKCAFLCPFIFDRHK